MAEACCVCRTNHAIAQKRGLDKQRFLEMIREHLKDRSLLPAKWRCDERQAAFLIACLHISYLGCELLDGVVPTDLSKLPRSPRPDTRERPLQPIRVIGDLQPRLAARTQFSL